MTHRMWYDWHPTQMDALSGVSAVSLLVVIITLPPKKMRKSTLLDFLLHAPHHVGFLTTIDGIFITVKTLLNMCHLFHYVFLTGGFSL